MESFENMKALYIIVNAGHVDDVMEVARKAGARGATIINARGESSRHEVFMGITVDLEKEIILCVIEEETADKVMEAIREKKGVKTPAHSVCFTIPVDKIVGIAPAEIQEG
ncbi:P-II family nitrogen regulator [Ruminococcaceae bacterium OttesenSCG-928-A16]|nr:P-II family nitrogen regulator [Ruminococcaceae bacterium OttesenSCG-928-A16]